MFRISTRDLLWLTLVIGLTIALYIERTQAELWRARADYVRRIVRDLGWESNWTGPTAKFEQVAPPPGASDAAQNEPLVQPPATDVKPELP